MTNNLRKFRWQKDWSQSRLSRKSGVLRSTIAAIESNDSANPTIQNALLLARALGTTVDELFSL